MSNYNYLVIYFMLILLFRWLNLCSWESHIAAMLGRPLKINLEDMETIPPIDVPAAYNRNESMPFRRGEMDPPTILTIQLLGHQIERFLVVINKSQDEASAPGEIDRVQQLRDNILNFREHLPSYL